MFQERIYLGPKRSVALALPVEVRLSLLFGKVARLAEDPRQLAVSLRIAHGSQLFNLVRSQDFAKRQSFFTVFSETPSTAPVSFTESPP